MAFLKYAHASIVKPAISLSGWDEVRAKTASVGPVFGAPPNKVSLQKYDPARYMLSHATIIASVDTENTGLPLGRQLVDGFQIDRRWDDFFITPKTSRYINNNGDSWERRLLLST